MSVKSIDIDERAKTVTVVLDLVHVTSSTGKMIMLATTNGWSGTNAGYDGKPVSANINIGIKAK
jgi:hypothetical protein